MKSAQMLPCYYCGEHATTWDHVVPKSVSNSTGGQQVPACSECNNWLGNRVYPNLRLRRAAAKRNLARHYSKYLNLPKWTEAELSEKSPEMRASIERHCAVHKQTLARIAYRGKRPLSDVKGLTTACKHCGKEFFRNLHFNAARKYCSAGCSMAAKAQRMKLRHPASKTWARAERPCENCGKTFMARPDGKFCNRRCRVTWWHETVRLGLAARAAQKKDAPAVQTHGGEGSSPKGGGRAARSAAKKPRKSQ